MCFSIIPESLLSPNNQNDVEKMTVLGVLAVDIKLQFIKQTVENLFPVCLESEKAYVCIHTADDNLGGAQFKKWKYVKVHDAYKSL